MTTSSPTITLDNTNTTTFRAWGSAISTALQAVGLVKHTDTGQIDFSTVTLSGTANSSSGYEIYRLNDALQSTKPIFMKIEYGTGVSTGTPAIYTTFSNSTNGAGSLNGSLTSTRKQSYGISSTTPQVCYFASDGSYLTMLLAPTLYPSNGSGFFSYYMLFDRTRDTVGAITGDGFQFMSSNFQGSTTTLKFNAVQFGSSGASSQTTGFSMGILSFKVLGIGEVGNTTGALSAYNGCAFFQASLNPSSTNYLGDTYYWPQVITTPNISYGLLILLGLSTEVPTSLTTISITVLGSAHTYMAISTDPSGIGSGAVRSLVRYE